MKNTYPENVLRLLKGSYDLHVHTAPSHFPRLLDDFELACALDRYGMAGALIKTHYGATAARAAIANAHSGARAKLFGGIVLDGPVGGLNPTAVESELQLGAKMVWMPTFHAKNHLEFPGMPQHNDPVPHPGIAILDDAGELLEAVHAIIALVGKYNATLATGHISVAESLKLCRAAADAGVRMVFTHSEFKRTPLPIDKQVELARMGVFIERSIRAIDTGGATMDHMVAGIRAAGVASSFLTTDYGQKVSPPAPEGMANFVSILLERGFTEGEITTMIRINPEKLLQA